jgi:hypothetical protein
MVRLKINFNNKQIKLRVLNILKEMIVSGIKLKNNYQENMVKLIIMNLLFKKK